MEKAMYKAALEGDVDFLREVRDREIETGCWNKHFLGSVTPQKNTIIHIASQHDRYEFLRSGFNFFNFYPLMIAKRNANGDTPLHVASKRGNKKIVELLVEASNKFVLEGINISNECKREISEGVQEYEGDSHEEEMPWRIKNMEGNTPLHEALINGKLDVATYLIEVDPQLGNFINSTGETPLHLAIKYNVDGEKKLATDTIEFLNKQRASLPYRGTWLAKESLSIIEQLLKKHNTDVYARDNEGLTPVLRAAVQSHFRAIEMILNKYPECLEMCDPEGKTIMHLINFQKYKETKNFLLKNPLLLNLKDQQDKKGNTPAHIAVMNCIKKISEERKDFEDHEYGVMMKFQSYEEASKFMKMPQLLSLKDGQDCGENSSESPIVVMNRMQNIKDEQRVLRHHDTIGVITAFFELSTNFSIKNKEGLSAAALFQQLKAQFSCNEPLLSLNLEIEDLLAEHKFKRKEEKMFWKAVECANVIFLRQELNMLESCLTNGLLSITDLFYILLYACEAKHSDDPKKNFCCYNREQRDRYGSPTKNDTTCCYEDVEELMQELFKRNSLFIYETNSRGDTPLHMLVRVQDHEISESLLHQMKQSYENDDQHEVYCPPWRVKNVEGNTPLHEALLHIAPNNNRNIIRFLFKCEPDIFQKYDWDQDQDLDVECDRDVAAYLNNRNETPLHVFCRYKNEKFADEDMIKEIIVANKWATLNRDAEGLTPLLRAALQGKVEIVKQIWELSPESVELRDCEGKTFWHLMDMSRTTQEQEAELVNLVRRKGNEKIQELSRAEDNAGIAPLVQAVKSHNYSLAQVLSSITNRTVYHVITEEAIGLRYTFFLLRFASHLPSKLEGYLWDQMKTIGVKSIFGVPKSEIKDYTNTIGVIAVLLATIAFTGAFTVPGGFDQTKGFPLLLKAEENLIKPLYTKQMIRIAAFWVFMVADILTMCLSMMVLFCLQWIVTGDDKDKLVLTDFSILLLNTAFNTTMVAMMMGVFASTHQNSSNLAIFTLSICSAVLLLLQKWLVMSPLQYVFLTGYLIQQTVWSMLPCKKWCDELECKESKPTKEASQ